jgi:hypothetical protein
MHVHLQNVTWMQKVQSWIYGTMATHVTVIETMKACHLLWRWQQLRDYRDLQSNTDLIEQHCFQMVIQKLSTTLFSQTLLVWTRQLTNGRRMYQSCLQMSGYWPDKLCIECCTKGVTFSGKSYDSLKETTIKRKIAFYTEWRFRIDIESMSCAFYTSVTELLISLFWKSQLINTNTNTNNPQSVYIKVCLEIKDHLRDIGNTSRWRFQNNTQ